MTDRQVETSFDRALADLRSTAKSAPSLPNTLDQRAHLIDAMRAGLAEAWPDATITAVVPGIFSAQQDTSNIPAGGTVKFKALEPFTDAVIAVTQGGDYWITADPGISMTIKAESVQAVTPFEVKVAVMRSPAMQIEVDEDGDTDYTHIVLDDLTHEQAAAFLARHPAHAQPASTTSTGEEGTTTRSKSGRNINIALAVLGTLAVLAAAAFTFNALRGGDAETASPQATRTSPTAGGSYGPMDPQLKALVLGWTIGTGNWGPLVAGNSTATSGYQSGAFVPAEDGLCGPATWHPELVEAWGGQENAPKAAWATDGSDPTLLGIAFTDPRFVAKDGVHVGSTLDDLRRAYGSDLKNVSFNWVVEPRTSDMPGVGTGAWTLFQINEAGNVEAIMIVPKTGANAADNVFTGC